MQVYAHIKMQLKTEAYVIVNFLTKVFKYIFVGNNFMHNKHFETFN